MSQAALRHWSVAAGTTLVFAVVLVAVSRRPLKGDAPERSLTSPRQVLLRRDWPLFGGSVARNLVNLQEKGMPVDWSVKAGAEQHIKWAARLGSKAYRGPSVCGGKIFIGTNNQVPR